MSQNQAQAAFFANNYFAVADGLVCGLENCLAEDVVLDWFGKTIKGRTNVAAFMNTHKVNSRHVFEEINATNKIGYNKRNRRSSAYKLKIQNENSPNQNITTKISSCSQNITIETPPRFESTPENKIISPNDRSRSSSKIQKELNQESNLTFELHDDDHSTLFKLENIKSTNVEEIEEKIDQITLKEKMKTISPSKNSSDIRELKNIDIIESSMKYIESLGEILFSKKSRRKINSTNCRLAPSNSTHTWRKPCKLQIAYSAQKINVQNTSANNNSSDLHSSSNSSKSEQKLPNLDEITEISNNVVLNDNCFAGYLRNINLFKEDDIVNKSFNENLSKNQVELGFIPRYINGQLVFQRKFIDEHNSDDKFLFNYTIHVIIYEGRSRCRMNLSQQFV